MCRMFGTIGQRNAGEAVACLSQLYSGGPDEQNLRFGQGWLLGHTRLSINGVLNGSQPFTDHGIQCLFVGEIYNFRELARRFALPLSSQPTDGEVIVELFNQYGPGFIELLEGMFSIAIIDDRHAGSNLYLFTDSCAIKPVYYKETSIGISFANDIKGMPELTVEDRQISAQSFDRYGAFRTFLGAQTIFPKIKVLEPSTYLHFDGSKTSICRYKPAAGKFETGIGPRQTFADDFANAVHHAMITDVTICTTLSGGLDSSLVATIAAGDRKMTDAFNVWYEGDWPQDETAFAREVAEKAALRYNQVTVADKDYPDLIVKMCRALSQPNAAAHCLSTYSIYQAISQAGFKVALVGEGADDFFGGYDRIAKVAADNDLDAYISDLCAIQPDIRRGLVLKGAQNTAIADDTKTFIESLPGNSMLRKILCFEAQHRLPYYILHRVDALSMAHSVEARVPFCFPSVYRHAHTSEDDQLVTTERRKIPIYDAAISHLPSSVIHREKQPFLLPIAGMLRPGYPVYDFLMDTINSPCKTHDLINFDYLKSLVSENMKRPSNKLGNALWAWMVFEIWAREHEVSIV